MEIPVTAMGKSGKEAVLKGRSKLKFLSLLLRWDVWVGNGNLSIDENHLGQKEKHRGNARPRAEYVNHEMLL